MAAPLRLVPPPPPAVAGERLEAEAMIDAATWFRARAQTLPESSPLRADWLQSADRFALVAQLTWPSVRRLRAADHAETAS